MVLSAVLRWVRVVGQPVARLRGAWQDGQQHAGPSLTAMDVLTYLRDGRAPTTALAATVWRRVDDALAALPQYHGELRCRRELRGLDRYVDRLPLIVTHYCRGHTDHEIAALLGGLATDYGVETTLAAAAAFIAARVNGQLA